MFIVLEIQQQQDGTVSILPAQTAETKDEAMSKYHGILQYAAVSTLRRHTCIVMDSSGMYYAKECYEHYQPEPEEMSE